jgi:hypothetical protein
MKKVKVVRTNVVFSGKGFISDKETFNFLRSSAFGQGQVSPKSLPTHRLKRPMARCAVVAALPASCLDVDFYA